MTAIEYEDYINSRCKPFCNEAYTVIALNGEAGEVAEWYKKYVLRGNPTGQLTLEDLKGELGDVLFYLTRLGSLYGYSLEDIMTYNKAKLDARSQVGMRSSE